jgi:predicted ABC-type transport system involved in lysophospholipase L1 biosynthesis ATPase subunit
MNDPALRLTGISRSYGAGAAAVHVLRGADLVLAAGEAVALTAPSGAWWRSSGAT